MRPEFPSHLNKKARAVEAEIRRAFAGVTRGEGRSWSEACLDWNPTDEELAAAREADPDRPWEELANFEGWRPDQCPMQWMFLDDIGFRYYLPAAMTRELQGLDGGLESASLRLTSEFMTIPLISLAEQYEINDKQRAQWRLFDHPQRQAIARFVLLMIEAWETPDTGSWYDGWRTAYQNYWWQFDPDCSVPK